ncbi:MAG: hypothetical protein KDC98_07520, partial [Planctomycetes bacterium]|nr:hypothetical protein [Planctomycetota bacterium]
DVARAAGGTLLLAAVRADPGLPPVVELFAAERPSGPWSPLAGSLAVPRSALDHAALPIRAARVMFAIDAAGTAREIVVSNAESTGFLRLPIPGR